MNPGQRVGKFVWIIVGLLVFAALAGCQDRGTDGGATVTVDADGVSRVYRYEKPISVGQFLEEIGMTLGEDDQVNPPLYTQVSNGMRITVTRIVRRTECQNEDLPYEVERQLTQALPPGEQRIMQTGENGTVEVCYRVTEQDGVQISRDEISRFVIKAPRNEQIYIGTEPPETLIPIEGVLAYVSGGQAYLIEGNTTNLRPLTSEGHLDGRVFDLSDNGRQLLYTRSTDDPNDPQFANELWALLDTAAAEPEPVQLVPDDVRQAQWVPGQRTYTVSYSTASPTTTGAGWSAYNDLYLMQLDPETGETLSFEEIIPPNALGVYAYWGRRYVWSPDGTQLAWALADSIGLVDLATGGFTTLLTFPEYATLLARSVVWIPTLSWSDDGFLVTVVHGPPYGAEALKDSIIFDTAVINPETGLQVNPLFARSGIWSDPVYSPMVEGPGGNPMYYLAYFQAREPLNSLGAQYDLVVADSDGSNPRVIFPPAGQTGFRPDPEDSIAWSPMARQLAFIYQHNLWVYDFETDLAYPVTSDGQASRPRWSRKR